ncbi:UDP-N-acetylmuramoylalanine--D-glutamate ligase [Hydrogenophaga crassostreae]|uniref:UDP-N-acetylmuramoylalanine--D-glutamate ligase n=1 Tax=Hydrogenophaga crassostreae TaxID=1763535 RepID=A0A167HN45_9BURK|nr:UDP-N-acetylmuramoyl-L-alanine--D-glutamate ligase [Hydrogenophaga crassostreae]AOW14914.1 UDP-N-acetylmuramoylalanine--D-glutamate ligase [Hydrogenophaga crassostreae]OAD41481.1 UDP-N-acetylmuramoylalanine--D-glutamate ligase [Hydrogenophaga crassostreae]
MNHLKDHRVLILGLGISGLAMARWCARAGASVTVADTRERPPQLTALQEQCPQATFVQGAFDSALLAQGDWTLVARSPGLAPDTLSEVREWAQQHGVPYWGELDLFAAALHELGQRDPLPYRPKVLGITGTNGKTTVTSLTGLLLDRSGVNVAIAGNIGPALLDVLSKALDDEAVANAEDQVEADRVAQEAANGPEPMPAPLAEVIEAVPSCESEAGDPEQGALTDDQAREPSAEVGVTDPASAQAADAEDDGGPLLLVPPPVEPPPPPHLPLVWVLELSSFQLDGVAGGAWSDVPTAATVLNISEDHLDWHGSLAAYADTKSAIFGDQALMLLNRDDVATMAFTPPMVTVKISGRNRQQPARAWASFGLDAPSRPGDWGLETVNGMTWLVRALAVDETRKKGRGQDEEDEIYFQRLMPADALRIRGRHNAANALAALALATSTGATLAPMLHGLREYRGEPHRVEPIAVIEGVEYFDDSKGTNVGATLAAIQGLGAERKLVLILGGDGKGQDFTPLAPALAQHARAVFLIGRDATAIRTCIEQALSSASVTLTDAASLPDAVALAASAAQPGDAVLLSPACSSLDQFDNYQHRAQVFVGAVTELAHAMGVDLEGAL